MSLCHWHVHIWFEVLASPRESPNCTGQPREATDKQMFRLCELKGLQCSTETNGVWKKARMRLLENCPLMEEPIIFTHIYP